MSCHYNILCMGIQEQTMSFKTRFFVSMLLGCLLMVAMPVYAQDGTPDPVDLATRLLDFDGLPAIPDPSPIYKVGDTAQFWVSKAGQDAPVQITAELAGAGADTYVWVEQGTAYDRTKMGEFAAEMSAIYGILRVRDNYGVVNTVPESPAQLEMIPALRMPDVDNDPHLYIVYANNLRDNRTAVYNPANSLESNLVPGGISNQHEMVLVNMTNFPPDVELNNAAYTNLLARQMYAMLAYYNNPSQPLWLQGATAWDTLLQMLRTQLQADDLQSFFADPRTPLTLTGTGAEFGAQQLFLRYVLQRFGFEVFRELFTGSGNGLEALDEALAARNITDLVTGEPITARDVFADFVMANALNSDLGDGRYKHVEPAADGLMAAVLTAEDQFDFDLSNQAVTQLGTNYLGLRATQPASFAVFFSGQDNNSRLPMPAGGASNHFYWSGETPNRDATLTRSFDLSGVQTATLTFDAWYTLTDGWNYAYVEVSEDEGKTWDILAASSTTTTNPNSLSYGDSFTGISNSEKPRPFPYLGVGLDPNDGLTLTEITDDGPLAALDSIQVGDTIAGYDGEVWEAEQPNLLVFLSNYEPGDTVNFYMKRGETFYDVDVTLGSHPERRKIPNAIWMAQTVDLSAYAGKPILLRFESISLPGNEDLGFAIDNISIPEVNFSDDAESGIPGWTLDGWQQTTNEIRQQFLVQAAVIGPDMNTINVTRLIGPEDNEFNGQWAFTLQANETLLLAISGLNDDTTLPGLYTLSARAATNEAPSSE